MKRRRMGQGSLLAALRRRLRRVPEAVARARLRRRILAAPPAAHDRPRVFYGYAELPSPDEPPPPGAVKFQRLAATYPNEPLAFNLFYSGSSNLLPGLAALHDVARKRSARIVWNQDGVVYPGLGWSMRTNRPLAAALRAADYVFYQSEFCKLSADKFLGEPRGGWETLYNAVDVGVFSPAEQRPDGLVLLLGGSQNQRYRVETALRTAALVARERPDVRLLVAGRLMWSADPRADDAWARALVEELAIGDRVEFVGAFSQREAPELYRRAHLLLHTKYNDPCPSTVIEAMASGLPVVYSGSGGVPELVGEEAGVAVPAPLDFDRDHPPDPQSLADAVLDVADRLESLGVAARARVVERFALEPWVERHRRVFEELLR